MAGMEQICRLCLNVIIERWQKLNFSEEVMLKFILLDLDITVTESPVICSQCLDTLQQCHDFKKLCLKTENSLNSSYHTETKNQLDLKCILNNDKCKIKYENENICRFCLEVAFLKLDKLEEDIFLVDMVRKCLPEFNLDVTEQPGICPVCMEKLQVLFNFVMACEDNDEKIKNCIFVMGVDIRGHVSLSDVLKFIDNMNNEDVISLEDEVNVVKVEMVEVETNVSYSIVANGTCIDEADDEFVETKEDVTPSVENPSKRETTASNSMIRCKFCPQMFPRYARARQMSHIRTFHKDVTALYQCQHCTFKTRFLKVLEKHGSRCSKNSPIHYNQRYVLQCRKCQKKFSKQVYLDGHILTHHPDLKRLIKSQVFRCEMCEFKTVHKADWLPHKCLDVVPYHCDQCDYIALRHTCLLNHKKMHENECQTCGKNFSRKTDLVKHEEEEYNSLIGNIDKIIERRS